MKIKVSVWEAHSQISSYPPLLMLVHIYLSFAQVLPVGLWVSLLGLTFSYLPLGFECKDYQGYWVDFILQGHTDYCFVQLKLNFSGQLLWGHRDCFLLSHFLLEHRDCLKAILGHTDYQKFIQEHMGYYQQKRHRGCWLDLFSISPNWFFTPFLSLQLQREYILFIHCFSFYL